MKVRTLAYLADLPWGICCPRCGRAVGEEATNELLENEHVTAFCTCGVPLEVEILRQGKQAPKKKQPKDRQSEKATLITA